MHTSHPLDVNEDVAGRVSSSGALDGGAGSGTARGGSIGIRLFEGVGGRNCSRGRTDVAMLNKARFNQKTGSSRDRSRCSRRVADCELTDYFQKLFQSDIPRFPCAPIGSGRY